MMNKKFLFLLFIQFFLFCFFISAKEKYELAVCAIFQDDAKYLPEWIEFHQAQGVQKFYLYNNLSQDNYKKILKPFIKKGLVKLIEWPFQQENLKDWNKIQRNAYTHCIQEIKSNVTWCAFIDTDEFLFCPNGMKLNKFLEEFKEFSGVGVNWVMYGTSKVSSIPDGAKLLEYLVWRAKDDHSPHIHVKIIVQPKDVDNCKNPHFFIFKNGGFSVTENKERYYGPFSPSISFNQIRINHYWSRDVDFFLNIKCERQKKWGLFTPRTIEYEQELNVIYDPMSNYLLK